MGCHGHATHFFCLDKRNRWRRKKNHRPPLRILKILAASEVSNSAVRRHDNDKPIQVASYLSRNLIPEAARIFLTDTPLKWAGSCTNTGLDATLMGTFR